MFTGCPRGATGTWEATPADVRAAEEAIREFLKTKTQQPFDNYYRQYLGVVMRDEKVLYVNAFAPMPPPDVPWRAEYLAICDGGDANWGLEYNTNTKQIENFQTNGPWTRGLK